MSRRVVAKDVTDASLEIKEKFRNFFYVKVHRDYDKHKVTASLDGDVIPHLYFIFTAIYQLKQKYPDVNIFIDY